MLKAPYGPIQEREKPNCLFAACSDCCILVFLCIKKKFMKTQINILWQIQSISFIWPLKFDQFWKTNQGEIVRHMLHISQNPTWREKELYKLPRYLVIVRDEECVSVIVWNIRNEQSTIFLLELVKIILSKFGITFQIW